MHLFEKCILFFVRLSPIPSLTALMFLFSVAVAQIVSFLGRSSASIVLKTYATFPAGHYYCRRSPVSIPVNHILGSDSVRAPSIPTLLPLTTLQCLVILRPSLRDHCRPRTAVLEAPQPSSEYWSPGTLYPHGGIHPRRCHSFLRQRDRPPGSAHYNWYIPGSDTFHITEQGKLSI